MHAPVRRAASADGYGTGSEAYSSGFFLLLGLLFVAAFISHRLAPARIWPSIVIGFALVLVYAFAGAWITS